ncbi:unnamed protein product [Brassica rapa]|uniref:Uncharacterized protein n=1 Tax=Brassica campestris TaxID=3711 RepID=A0A8D9MGU6_BRACM|nr:unnamed protein product [Brassica rapa]
MRKCRSENHERNRGAQTKEEANYSNRLRCAEPVFGITEIAPHIQLVSAATEKSYSRAPPGVLKVAERKKFEKLVVPKQKPTTSCLLPENLHAAGSEKHTRCRTHAPHNLKCLRIDFVSIAACVVQRVCVACVRLHILDQWFSEAQLALP